MAPDAGDPDKAAYLITWIPTLEAVPPQAEVYEDDILLGATPLTISRPPGTLTSLRLEAKGFQPLSRKVRFESDTFLYAHRVAHVRIWKAIRER